MRVWGEPDVFEAGWAHWVDYVVVYPRLADYVGDRVVENDPRCVGDDLLFGLIIERVALA